MHRHLHRPQQPLGITASDGRPGPTHHIGNAQAVQRHLHGLCGAASEEELLPAVPVALDENMCIEVPLVEQQGGEVVGRQLGKGFFWFGHHWQPAGVDPAEANLQVVHQSNTVYLATPSTSPAWMPGSCLIMEGHRPCGHV